MQKDKFILTGFFDEVSSIARVVKNKVMAKTNLENSILRWAKLPKMKKKAAVEDLKKCLTSEVGSFLSKKFLQDFKISHQNPQFESIYIHIS